jgi:hypothetical protein
MIERERVQTLRDEVLEVLRVAAQTARGGGGDSGELAGIEVGLPLPKAVNVGPRETHMSKYHQRVFDLRLALDRDLGHVLRTEHWISNLILDLRPQLELGYLVNLVSCSCVWKSRLCVR